MKEKIHTGRNEGCCQKLLHALLPQEHLKSNGRKTEQNEAPRHHHHHRHHQHHHPTFASCSCCFACLPVLESAIHETSHSKHHLSAVCPQSFFSIPGSCCQLANVLRFTPTKPKGKEQRTTANRTKKRKKGIYIQMLNSCCALVKYKKGDTNR